MSIQKRSNQPIIDIIWGWKFRATCICKHLRIWSEGASFKEGACRECVLSDVDLKKDTKYQKLLSKIPANWPANFPESEVKYITKADLKNVGTKNGYFVKIDPKDIYKCEVHCACFQNDEDVCCNCGASCALYD